MAKKNVILTDEELMDQLIQNKNPDVFSILVNRHIDRFYGLCFRLLWDRQEAEDAVQESFLKLWRKPESWNPKKQSKFTTWFYRVVMNLCLDWRKKKKPAFLDDFELEDASSVNSEKINLKKKRDQKIQQAIYSLPVKQQMVLTLCFYEGLTNQEAADVLGFKLKATQSLILRAKAKLKEILMEEVDHA